MTEPDFAAVRAAADRLAGHALRTPVLRSRRLDQRFGVELYAKAEHLQHVGAFKFRGAYNALSRLSAAQREAGVLTFSSGNHAQAVALAGRLLGIDTTVVMPRDAPAVKRAGTREHGARVIEFDPARTTREALAAELQAQQPRTLIPPYDHPDVIAGQGTATLELLEDAGDLDMLLVPCGGGGLLSGAGLVVRALQPRCRLVGVEPALADDATRSFRTGRLHRVHNPPTIADGTRTPSLGELTFPIIRRCVDDMVTVDEDAIRAAVRLLLLDARQVVEPSGALPVAALLSQAVAARGRVGVLLSGGNVDPQLLSEILAAGG
jgi:threonine dehydratase